MKNILLGSLMTLVFLTAYYFLLLPGRTVIDLNLRLGQTLENDLVTPVDIDIPYSPEELSDIQTSARDAVPVHLLYSQSSWMGSEMMLRPILHRLTEDSLFTEGVLNELSILYETGVFDLQEVREQYTGEQAILIRDGMSSDMQLFDLYEIGEAREMLMMNLSRWDIPDSERELLASTLNPNLQPDDSSRLITGELAVSGLNVIDTTIAAGSILLRESDPVTERTLEYIIHMQTSSSSFRGISKILAIIALVLVLTAIMFVYVRSLMENTWRAANRFLLLGIIWILSLAATGFLWIVLRETTGYPYASLVTFGAAMTSIFFHRRDAIFFTFMFSLILGVSHPHPFSIVLISSVSGTLAAIAAWDVRKRSSIPTAIGLASAGGTGVFILLYISSVSLETSPLPECIFGLMLAPVIGIGSASALLFLFERIFGVYTVLAIDEANRTDHPLLKQMKEIAPGTWSHSQTVAELAGRAAAAVNAWESLASAGGFFHDIGKMRYPEFFIENQRNIENPHDSMNPWESARKIIDHVRIGVEMAEEAKLPGAVIDVIAQHHGTCLTRYFYNKALQNSQDRESVREDDFRYPGPRPASVEAALILLADQAASATKNLDSSEQLGSIVQKTVYEIDLDGQLDDCHLSRRNLKTIIEVFTSSLESKYYRRVQDYPGGETIDT